jgi:hypothetical protein
MAMEFLRYLGIAFVSSAILIVLSKIVLQKILRRPADYYLKEEYKQEELILNSAGFRLHDEVETSPEGEVTGEHVHAEPQIPVFGPEAPGIPLTKSGRPRKPSMSMKKSVLIKAAENRGITVPEGATKRDILDLIYAGREKKAGE